MKTLGLGINYKSQHSKIFKGTVLVTSMSFLLNIFAISMYFVLGFKDPYLLYISFCNSYISSLRMFYISQFIFACATIKARFIIFNRYLGLTSNSFQLQPCLEVYHSLCDAIDITNRSFTPHFILLFPNMMVNLFTPPMKILNV